MLQWEYLIISHKEFNTGEKASDTDYCCDVKGDVMYQPNETDLKRH